MIKTRKIKVKSIENEEIIMAMTMTKTIITKTIILLIIIIESNSVILYKNVKIE